jgi:DNA-binding NtrC family response regulator
VKFTAINLINILKTLDHNDNKILDNKNDILKVFQNDYLKDIKLIFLNLNIYITEDIPDSYTLIKKIKDIDNNIKIVVISDRGKQKELLKAIQTGASDYIEKPLSKEKVEEVIKKI